jgi:hypothetical protein
MHFSTDHRHGVGASVELIFQEKFMYVRTNRAAIWVEQPAAPNIPQQPSPLRSSSSSVQAVRWAKKPLPVPKGNCVALRQDVDGISVGLRSSDQRLIWLPAEKVLSAAQLRRWVQECF